MRVGLGPPGLIGLGLIGPGLGPPGFGGLGGLGGRGGLGGPGRGVIGGFGGGPGLGGVVPGGPANSSCSKMYFTNCCLKYSTKFIFFSQCIYKSPMLITFLASFSDMTLSDGK